MGFGLLFVPLVGGYLFLSYCNLTRFTGRRQGGYRLIFRSAAVGLGLIVLARVVVDVADRLVGRSIPVFDYLVGLAPFPYSGTIALAFVLGPAGALLVNCVYSESKGAMRAVHRAGNSMELLFVQSMRSGSVVELTLLSGKVYVGWLLNADVADPERRFAEMLPLASGFRTEETHELRFTTNYALVLNRTETDTEPATREDFRVVVPVTEIRSARPFDFVTYFEFQDAADAT